MGSRRLPGKVLLPLCGKPVLWHVLKRVEAARHIGKVLVATSECDEDDVISNFCKDNAIPHFRGSLTDVLDRFYHAAEDLMKKGFHISHIVRITADCPLIDPSVIDLVVEASLAHGTDYTSNVVPPTYPDGLDVEVIRYTALEFAYRNATYQSEREHVTPYIINNPVFTRFCVKNEKDNSDMRWTLDNPEDYQFIRKIYEGLYKEGEIFHMNDIIRFIKMNPEIQAFNSEYTRNEGYKRSLKLDRVVQRRLEGTGESDELR